MILYHRTTAVDAEQILRDGFRDSIGTYMTTRVHSGVWLSNVPLDINEGAEGDTLLQLELPEELIADYRVGRRRETVSGMAGPCAMDQ